MEDSTKVKIAVFGIINGIFLLLLLIMMIIPQWRVWSQGKEGEAELRRAEQNRQIQVEQAKAEFEAAQHRADAIKVVGQAAKDFPEYRHQEFIGAFGEAMKEGHIQKIIYVPTEANIPIIERQ